MRIHLAPSGTPALTLDLKRSGNEWRISSTDLDGVGLPSRTAMILERRGTRLTFVLDGTVRRAHVQLTAQEVRVWMDGYETTYLRSDHARRELDKGQERGSGVQFDPIVRATVPGKVLRVSVVAGQVLSAGDPLVVIEAMKMEHTVVADADGSVLEVHVSAGAMVRVGEPLVSCEWRVSP